MGYGKYPAPSPDVAAVWGSITGTLSAQTDLQSALNTKAASGANTDITSVLLNQTGLKIKGGNTNALNIKPNETFTAARVLNLIINDVDRTINLSGNLTVSSVATISGTNTGDQTITLTGDVTGSGTGSFATIIGANKVTDTMLNTMATASFKGRTTAGTGNVEVLSATQATAILNVFGADSGSGGVKGMAPATVAGDSAKFLKGDGTWASASSSITEWASYTPSFVGFGTCTGIDFWWRRVGDSYEVQGTFVSGTATAVEGQIGLPNSGTSDNSGKIPQLRVVGFMTYNNADATEPEWVVLGAANKTYVTYGYRNVATIPIQNRNGNDSGVSAKSMGMNFTIPINGLGV